MKLLNYTTKYFALLLIALISVWAVAFYFAMLEEIYDSLDDSLENQKELIIQASRNDSTLLHVSDFGIGNFTIHKTSFVPEEKAIDSYRDTLMYMQNEKEYEPIRILESVFEQKGSYYKIKLITSMVEEDDQIENLIKYLIGLYLILVASIVLLNNLILKRVWRPFYNLLDRLKGYRIEKDDSIKTVPGKIDEFNMLNQSVEKLTRKSRDSYVAQKEFIENASHEIQTPLAIAINKLELLIEKNDLTEDQSLEVAAVLDTLTRLTKLNRSLLMLSKIENRQYPEEELIDFNELTEHIIHDFEDFASHRDMSIRSVSTSRLTFQMNKDLAAVLLNNLLKNALVHGVEGKAIEVVIDSKGIIITNHGVEKELDKTKLFKRFRHYSPGTQSTGLGLAISQAIAAKYGLALRYSYSGKHNFTLRFPGGASQG